MLSRFSKNVQLVLAAVLGAVLAGGSWAGAAAIVDNAHRVDGFHAVGAGTAPADRGRRLVATNRRGRLPNNIIDKAPNADRLDGLNSRAFLRRNADVDAQTLDGLDSGAFMRRGAALDADTIDGVDSADLVRKTDAIDADTLDGATRASLASDAELRTKQDALTNVTVVNASGASDAGNGAALLAAVLETTGTQASPAVIRLSPGTFEVADTLFLNQHVSLRGAGRGTTRLVGTGSGATLVLGQGSEVSDLTLEKQGVASAVGIRLHGATIEAAVRRVEVTVQDGTTTTVAVSAFEGELVLEDVRAYAYSGGSVSGFGLTLTGGADAEVYDSLILGRGGPKPAGVAAESGSSLLVFGSDVEGRSGTQISTGVSLSDAYAEFTGSTIRANASPEGWVYGIEASGNRTVHVRGSRIEAWRNYQVATQSYTVVARSGAKVRIGATQLDGGGVYADASANATAVCAGVYDENYAFLQGSCPSL